MPEYKQSPDFFTKFVTVVILILIAVNIYTGATIQEVGIPGVFMVKFGEKEETKTPEPSQYINPVSIEAENYNESSAHVLALDSGSSRILGYINDEEWTRYDYINLGTGKIRSITARVASGENGGIFEVRLDSPTGTLIGMCEVPSTGGWENWQIITCDPINDVESFTSIYFVYKGQGTYLFNIDWVEFK